MMSARKTVCFFNSCRTWGGGEKWHFDVATGLDLERFRVLAGVNHGSALHKRLERAGVPCSGFSLGNLSFINPFKVLRLAIWFRCNAVEAVVLNLPADLKAAGLAARLAGVPRIIYRRGSAIPVRNSLLNRLLFRHVVTEVIANSQETKRTILDNNARFIAAERIHVIYNGLDLQAFDADCCAQPQPGRELVLGHAGRLSRQKNQKDLIDLAARLKELGVEFRLLIAGSGELQPQLQDYARERGVAGEIDFLGFVSDIKAFMASIDVFVLTSLWEGFGYVLVEAMAAGRPVLAYRVSSNPEIVADDKSGYLVPLGDVNALADRVCELAAAAERRREMGAAGRARVERLFDLKKNLQEVAGLLLDDTFARPAGGSHHYSKL